MNPPFGKAAQFVAAALERCPVVVALLPLNWIEPAERRRGLLAASPDVAVLPHRPRFLGGSRQTGFISCAWFTWPGRGRLTYLPSAPPAAGLCRCGAEGIASNGGCCDECFDLAADHLTTEEAQS